MSKRKLLLYDMEIILFVDSFGSIKAAELSWGNEDDISAVGPPFDYIIGTDVVCLLSSFCSFFFFFRQERKIEIFIIYLPNFLSMLER